MSDLRYQRIMRAVRSTAWAIQPRRLNDIMDVLAYHAAGGKMSAEEIAEFMELHAASKRERVASSRGVAVLGLRGIIANRIEQVDNISGPEGTSVEGFRGRLREALDSDRVGAVVLDVDSPGGAVDGVMEMGDEIRSLRGNGKPIVAVANTLAASAAYWLASQADEVVVVPSGEVGSIGVFAAHVDESAAMEQAGERVTLVSAGKFKTEGNPFEPLGEEAREALQGRVDEVYERFVDAVAAGRGVSAAKVRNGFGEGRTVSAPKALAEGMVDRVETLEATIERLRGTPRRRASRAPAAAFEFLESADAA